MPKFLIHVTVDTYWNYVAECENATDAYERADRDFDEVLDTITPTIHVELVDDDCPEGDA